LKRQPHDIREARVETNPTWPLTGAEERLPDQVAEVASAIRGEATQLTTEKTMPGVIALIYVVRTSRNLDATAHLCRQGFAAEAAGIVRAIAEDAVALAYLADDPDTRAETWTQFAEARLDRNAQAGGPPGGPNWWSGMGPTSMAGKLRGQHRQIGEEFSRLYWRLCDDAHGSPISARHYMVFPGEMKTAPTLLTGPSSYRIAEVCSLACAGATRVCAVAAELGVQLDLVKIEELAVVAAGPYHEGRTTVADQ
jgi:hypothetical protein